MSTGEKRLWEQNEFNAAVTQVDAPPFDTAKFLRDQQRETSRGLASPPRQWLESSSQHAEVSDTVEVTTVQMSKTLSPPRTQSEEEKLETPQIVRDTQKFEGTTVNEDAKGGVGPTSYDQPTAEDSSAGVTVTNNLQIASVSANAQKGEGEDTGGRAMNVREGTKEEPPAVTLVHQSEYNELGVQVSDQNNSEGFTTESSSGSRAPDLLECSEKRVGAQQSRVNSAIGPRNSSSRVEHVDQISGPETQWHHPNLQREGDKEPSAAEKGDQRTSPTSIPLEKRKGGTPDPDAGTPNSLSFPYRSQLQQLTLEETTSSPEVCQNTRTEMRSEPDQANTTPQIYSHCGERSSFATPLTAPLPYVGGFSSDNSLDGGSSMATSHRDKNSKSVSENVPEGSSSSAKPGPLFWCVPGSKSGTPDVQSRISRIEEAFNESALQSAPPGDSSVPPPTSTSFDFVNLSPIPVAPCTPGPSQINETVETAELFDTPADFNLSQLHFYTPGSAKPQLNQAIGDVCGAEETSLLGELLGKDTLSTPNIPSSDYCAVPPPADNPLASGKSDEKELATVSRPTSRKHSSPPGGSRGRANLLCSDDEESDSQGGSQSDTSSAVKPVPGMPPKWEDFPEAYDVRPIAEGVPPEQLEEHERRTIYVLHKGETNIVSWMEETPARDVREAILCACDSIADTGFLLRELIPLDKNQLKAMLDAHENEVGGQLILVEDNGRNVYYKRGQVFAFEDFHRLEGNKLYYLELSREREDLKSITGDRWRRLLVPIKPFQHVEAQKAIQRMRQGTNLLKHTTLGYPHLRHFQLSADLRRLIWYSAGKSKDQTIIQLANVSQIKIGIDDSVKLNGLPQAYTFTVVAGKDGTYQLAAKDEEEFDLWVTGLKALACWAHGQLINKAQLLSHCRRFRQALQRQDLSVRLDDKSGTTSFSLINAIKLTTLKKGDLLKKEINLRCRLKAAREKAKLIDIESLGKKQTEDEDFTAQEAPHQTSAYGAAMFDSTLSDDQMEFQKMCELMDLVASLLADARSQLEALNIKPLESDVMLSSASHTARQHTDENRSPPREEQTAASAVTSPTASPETRNAVLNNVTKLLWKAEVDTENIEDIYKRLTEPPSITVHKIWGEVNNNIASLTKNITSWVQTRGTSMLPMLFSGSDPAAPTTTPASHVEETATEQAATSD